MSTNMSSDKAKSAARAFLRRLLGETTQPVGYRPDWLITKDGATSVFVTFSTNENLFYDVGHKDLVEWDAFKRAFIVFQLGSHDKALVIPTRPLRAKLAEAQRVPSEEYGDYKLHLATEPSGYCFRELPGWNLTEYFNNYFPLITGRD